MTVPWSLDILSAGMTDVCRLTVHVFILSVSTKKMCKHCWTNDRFVATLSTELLTAQALISRLSCTESFTFLCSIVLPGLPPTPQGGLWIDTTGPHLTNCPHPPASLLSEVSHIRHLLVLLQAVGTRTDLARNSSVTWARAVTGQPAAHPYMEPCPIRTIKCKQAVGNIHNSVEQRGRVARPFVSEARHTLRQLKRTCELTPVQTSGLRHTQRNFRTDNRNPWAPLPMTDNTCLIHAVTYIQLIEKIFIF